jgi:hypothetical protein
MYKNTSESLNYLKRVASHATKPRASGRIDDIPWWAEKPEGNTIIQEYQAILSAANQAVDIRFAEKHKAPEIPIVMRLHKVLRRKQNAETRLHNVLEEAKSYSNSPIPQNLKNSISDLTNNVNQFSNEQEKLELLWLEIKLAELSGEQPAKPTYFWQHDREKHRAEKEQRRHIKWRPVEGSHVSASLKRQANVSRSPGVQMSATHTLFQCAYCKEILSTAGNDWDKTMKQFTTAGWKSQPLNSEGQRRHICPKCFLRGKLRRRSKKAARAAGR